MKTAKTIALIGVFTAMLIAGQMALSFIPNVEIVTVMLLSFSIYFGVVRSIAVATLFSLIRCLIFGFYPSVITLYLVYFNLFALVFGLIGAMYKKPNKFTVKEIVFLSILVTFFTALFTLLDDVITPLIYNFSGDAFSAYFISSLPFMGIQCASALVSSLILLRPLCMAYSRIYPNEKAKYTDTCHDETTPQEDNMSF